MITRLSDITLKDFIEVLCGNLEVLHAQGEEVSRESLSKTASDLIYDYRMIINPSGMEAALMDKEEVLKANTKIVLAKTLDNLLTIGQIEDVKKLMSDMGYEESTVQDIKDRLNRIGAEANYIKKKIESDSKSNKGMPRSSEDIRKDYDQEIAFLMTYYKMSIDARTITAGIYANMLHQADVEIKRKSRSRT